MKIGSIILTTILITWLVYSIWLITFMRRMFKNNLKYLLKPNVNFMKKCEAGARYDAVNLKLWKICLIGVFIAPIRLMIAIPIALSTYAMVFLVKSIYGGKFYSLKKNSDSRK